MAGKAKTEASEAIKQLSYKLRGDTKAQNDLGILSKYYANLRKGKRDASEKTDRLLAALKNCKDDKERLQAENTALKREAYISESKQRQLARDIVGLNEENAKLTGTINELQTYPDEETVDIHPDIEQLFGIAKRLRRRIKHSPDLVAGKKIAFYTIRLDDVVRDYTDDEFLTLGMMTAVLACFNTPIAVTKYDDSQPPKWKNKKQFEKLAPLVRWMSGWLSLAGGWEAASFWFYTPPGKCKREAPRGRFNRSAIETETLRKGNSDDD